MHMTSSSGIADRILKTARSRLGFLNLGLPELRRSLEQVGDPVGQVEDGKDHGEEDPGDDVDAFGLLHRVGADSTEKSLEKNIIVCLLFETASSIIELQARTLSSRMHNILSIQLYFFFGNFAFVFSSPLSKVFFATFRYV